METINATMAHTLEKVTIRVTVPHGKAARQADLMDNLTADTLIYSPKAGLVDTAGSAVQQVTDLAQILQDCGALPEMTAEEEEAFTTSAWDTGRVCGMLNRDGWEAIFDDANITVANAI